MRFDYAPPPPMSTAEYDAERERFRERLQCYVTDPETDRQAALLTFWEFNDYLKEHPWSPCEWCEKQCELCSRLPANYDVVTIWIDRLITYLEDRHGDSNQLNPVPELGADARQEPREDRQGTAETH